MKDYICKSCKYNNNGWCTKIKKDGLTKIQECGHLQSDTFKKVKIERTAKDYYGQQMVEITINNENVSFPDVILKDFISDPDIKKKEFEIDFND